MVKKESWVYLFIGQDSLSKDIILKKLKNSFLTAETQYFNLDVLYGRELTLKGLQEKLLNLPFMAKKRIVVVKDSQSLKDDIKGFIVNYVKKPQDKIILVLDINKYSPQDDFIRQVLRYSEVSRFKEDVHVDTFVLSRAIDSRKPTYALKVLDQLLRNGEKPERILGGLRYSWENSVANAFDVRRKLGLLLDCDINMKTGRLKPDFALERLVVNLCCFAKPSG